MNLYLDSLLFTLNIVTPIFLLVLLGVVLKKSRVIDEPFTATGSRLVFTITLPALVFTSIAKTDFMAVFNPELLSFVVGATLVVFALLWFFAKRYITNSADCGVFIQGAFRSNYGIIGLAVSYNLFSDSGLAQAALILALIIPLFNVLSIIALIPCSSNSNKVSATETLKEVIKNPLIIAVLVALPFSYYQLNLPGFLLRTGDYLASITLPLALLTIGSSLNLKSLRDSSQIAIWATLSKLLFIPLAATLVAWLVGFSGQNLMMLMVLFACPTAAASFIMAKAMGGNATLAANIVLTTTVSSVLTLSLGIYLLKLFGTV